MINKRLIITLACLLLVTANFSPISAQIQADKTALSIAKVKKAVLKRGTGENKRLKVKMRDGTEFRGYINQAGEDSFELIDSKTGQNRSIFYRDVAKVKGNGLSKTVIISIAGLGAAAAVILYVVLAPICNEGGC